MNNNIEYLYNGFIKVFKRKDKDVVQTRNSVAAVVYHTTKDRYIFIKQYRPGSDKVMIEIPAGGLDSLNENSKHAILREVEEETGYKGHLQGLKSLRYPFFVSPGYSTEKMQLFYIQVDGDQGETDGEAEEIIELSRDEVVRHYNDEKINDMKTIFALSSIGII